MSDALTGLRHQIVALCEELRSYQRQPDPRSFNGVSLSGSAREREFQFIAHLLRRLEAMADPVLGAPK